MAVLALVGSGEFLPWARDVDRWCAERATASSDRALIVPTASAPEGEEVFARWAGMGTEHYRALGLEPQVLELRVREDAEKPDLVDAVEGARLIFFSGGNPGYLAETLAGTPFWDAVRAAVAAGTALGGCSAGAVFLGARAPFVADDQLSHWVGGLGLLARAFVMPHFDMLDRYAPGLRALFIAETPPGARAVGIDEETALCGDGERWTVFGKGVVWISEEGTPDQLEAFRAGEQAEAALGLTL